MITVHVRIDDFPDFVGLTTRTWTRWITGALIENGVPITEDGELLRGRLFRLDDLTDFGKVEYRWYSDDEWEEMPIC